MSNIKVNKAKCLKCNDVIESKTRHEFNTCSCGNLSVDGGHSYIKRCVKEMDMVKDLSEYDKKYIVVDLNSVRLEVPDIFFEDSTTNEERERMISNLLAKTFKDIVPQFENWTDWEDL